jgi:ribosome maturation factor RimP
VGDSPLFISGDVFLVGAKRRATREVGPVPFDEAHVREIAERVASSSGLEIVDIEYHGGGKGRVLRIFIEKNAEGRAASAEAPPAGVSSWDQLAGVTHEDCANFSRELGTILDVEDAVPGSGYLLEVSSPGLDRKLARPADFQRFAGSKAKLMTREPIAGNRHFEGRLLPSEGDLVRLQVETGSKGTKKKLRQQPENGAGATLEIPLSNIERARLVPEFK